VGEVKERSPLFNGEARKKLIERVYRSSFQKLCWFSYTIAEDMETAEELTTEAFVRLMEHQPELYEESEEGIIRYLCASIRNISLNWIKGQKFREHLSLNATLMDDLSLFQVIADPNETPEQKVSRQEMYNTLHNAIEQLSLRQKKCIEFYIQGLDHNEIAKRMNITPDASRSLRARAIENLRSILGWNLNQ
jgi:RNA polymerase sigma-70 factor (ECF subfamily)